MYICSWPKSSVVQWFIEEKSRSHWAVYRCGFMASSTRCANERVSGKSLRSTWSRTVRKWCNGKRQLICLARVLLQRNTIIVLEESTANVDPETEKTILGVVREKLRLYGHHYSSSIEHHSRLWQSSIFETWRGSKVRQVGHINEHRRKWVGWNGVNCK